MGWWPEEARIRVAYAKGQNDDARYSRVNSLLPKL